MEGGSLAQTLLGRTVLRASRGSWKPGMGHPQPKGKGAARLPRNTNNAAEPFLWCRPSVLLEVGLYFIQLIKGNQYLLSSPLKTGPQEASSSLVSQVCGIDQ